MRLYSISNKTEVDNDCPDFWMAVWACNEIEALVFAQPIAMKFGWIDLLVVSSIGEDETAAPKQSIAHEERRLSSQRDLGWKSEGGSPCVCCNRHSMDEPEFAVCYECGLCRECATDESNDPCDECRARNKTENKNGEL